MVRTSPPGRKVSSPTCFGVSGLTMGGPVSGPASPIESEPPQIGVVGGFAVHADDAKTPSARPVESRSHTAFASSMRPLALFTRQPSNGSGGGAERSSMTKHVVLLGSQKPSFFTFTPTFKLTMSAGAGNVQVARSIGTGVLPPMHFV